MSSRDTAPAFPLPPSFAPDGALTGVGSPGLSARLYLAAILPEPFAEDAPAQVAARWVGVPAMPEGLTDFQVADWWRRVTARARILAADALLDAADPMSPHYVPPFTTSTEGG